MVYSSSMITAVARYGYEMDFFYQKQKMAMILAFIVMIVLMIVPYKLYQNKKFLMVMMFSITVALLFVEIFGHTAGGAQSWIRFGSSSIQPAEFAKIAMIIYLSAIYGKRQDRINNIDKAVTPSNCVSSYHLYINCHPARLWVSSDNLFNIKFDYYFVWDEL